MKNTDKVVIASIIVIPVIIVAYFIVKILFSSSVGASFGYGILSGSVGKQDKRIVVTDAPIQVIYRIDDHRFLTLENYISCDKSGQTYYNDTALNIRTRLEIYDRDLLDSSGHVKIKNHFAGDEQIQMKDIQNGIMAYSGFLINNSTNGSLAFPYINNTWSGCNNNYGCYQGALVSTDKGKTFYRRDYERSFNPPTTRTIAIVNDSFYSIGNDYGYGVKKIPFQNEENISEDNIKIDKNIFSNHKYDIHLHCNNKIRPSQIKFVTSKKESDK